MTIHELTGPECEEFLNQATIGRLACARKDQPYIVPVSLYYAREERCLYSFSTAGKKIEWMRDNPKVCVEVDAITDQYQWTTVLVTGRYEEIDLSEQQQTARQRAMQFFQQRPLWWLPGGAKLASGVEHDAAVVYRIHVASMSGRRAVRRPPLGV